MFLDRIEVYVKGGDGGDGCVSFRRESRAPRGGPNGGDGGHGGHVIVRAERNVDSLAPLTGHKHWRAPSGDPGTGNNSSGKQGKNLEIVVPPGTLVFDTDRGHLLKDLTHDGDFVVVAQGGRGGRGNVAFATSTNRAPREFEEGGRGEERNIALELKVIADVGLVGKPNAGKSTLLSRLSRAHPEIADYPFTTKYPNLGMVMVDYDFQFVIADIPGLIEGAHAGIGLGHEFLKHVERCKVLIHLVEPDGHDQTDPIENYFKIREELKLYDSTLLERPEIVAITKGELPAADEWAELLQEKLNRPVLCISAVTGKGLPQLISAITRELRTLQESAAV